MKTDLRNKIIEINKSTNTQFAKKDIFYQSFKPLNFKGYRDTEYRIDVYNIKKFLNSDHDVLNIGSNCGFIDIEIAKKCKSVTSIEPDFKLTEICNLISNEFNIKNIKTINNSFTDVNLNKKFNMILSLAVHKWVDMDLFSYIKKINSFLKKDGLILLESHILSDKKNKKDYEEIKEHLLLLGYEKIFENTILAYNHNQRPQTTRLFSWWKRIKLTDLLSDKGVWRNVYNHPYNNDFVIKINKTKTDMNKLEYNIWEKMNDEQKKHVAPIISYDGEFLIQKKGSPIEKNELPDKIPDFILDIKNKPKNWIKINDEILVCDLASYESYKHVYGKSLNKR